MAHYHKRRDPFPHEDLNNTIDNTTDFKRPHQQAWGVVRLMDNEGNPLTYDDEEPKQGKFMETVINSIADELGLGAFNPFASKNEGTETSPFYDVQTISTNEWDGEKAKGVPTAMFHGFGDMCLNPGIGQIDKLISKGLNAPVHCIEVGLPSIGEVINNFEHVAEKSCQEVAANKDFHGEFNVIGLSQGGLLARYIAESCDMPGRVRNILTAGGPHMGVDAIPHCLSGVVCDVVNFFAKKLVYSSMVQNWLAPAGYFRDVNNFETYQKNSVFLPAVNNEQTESGWGGFADVRKDRFTNLHGGMFIMFSQDTMIYPKETAWFQQLDKHGKVLPLNSTDFYNKDYIGLKNLTETGRAQFKTVNGDHLQFTLDDVNNMMIPFLAK